jgi:RNA polymerase sigma factor (TIGR02999 family)
MGTQASQAVTALVVEARQREPEAVDRLATALYAELRDIAHRQMRRERPDHTLGTTGLVHEAYLRLVDQTRVFWSDRSQFLAAAAQAMRRILVNHARDRRTIKRGGDRVRVDLDDMALSDERADGLIELNDALNDLAALSQRLAQVVECRFFGGLTEDETAHVLGITVRTVRRDWVKAKAWLYESMDETR